MPEGIPPGAFTHVSKDGTIACRLSTDGPAPRKKHAAMDPTMLKAMVDEYQKIAHDLTEGEKAHLPKKDFAVSASKSNTGDKAYPIPDKHHAAVALGFAKMHGDSADLASVKAKIKQKYPEMLKDKEAGLNPAIANGVGKAMGSVGAPGLAKLKGERFPSQIPQRLPRQNVFEAAKTGLPVRKPLPPEGSLNPGGMMG